LVAEIAFLLLTREPAAEKEAGELVQRTARSFPDQRRSILDRCVRLAEQAVAAKQALLAVQIARIGAELAEDLVDYLETRTPHLKDQLRALTEDRHVYSKASWYKKGRVRQAVLDLLDRAPHEQVAASVGMIFELSRKGAAWRTRWIIHAVERGVDLSDYWRAKFRYRAKSLPDKERRALLRALDRDSLTT
jgi:hypothetical protein